MAAITRSFSARDLLRALLFVPLVGLTMNAARAAEPAVTIPAPAVDAATAGTGPQTIVLAGGCFWGMEAVFEPSRACSRRSPAMPAANKATAHYDLVSTGTTGHAESVQVTFDPAQISYSKILTVYFTVAHDPTELNFQGPDEGTQYRSAIFYANDEQRIAEAAIAQLTGAALQLTDRHEARTAERLLSRRSLALALRRRCIRLIRTS